MSQRMTLGELRAQLESKPDHLVVVINNGECEFCGGEVGNVKIESVTVHRGAALELTISPAGPWISECDCRRSSD